MQIYKITDLKTGLIYIGKDRNDREFYYGSGKWFKRVVNSRFKKYVESTLGEKYDTKNKIKYARKYGNLIFKKEILEECGSLQEMSEREIFWIEYYNSTDKSIGYNLTKGPGTFGYSPTEETKDKFRVKFSIPVYQYDLQMNFVKKHKSIKSAKEETVIDAHSIISCCKYRSRQAGGFIWSYQPIIDIDKINKLKQEFILKPYIDNSSKEIYKYDKITGVLLEKYDSATLASNNSNVNINSIIFVCRNKRLTGGGYIWSYKELSKDEIKEKVGKVKYFIKCPPIDPH